MKSGKNRRPLHPVGSSDLICRSDAEQLYEKGVELEATHAIHGWVDAGKKGDAMGQLWGDQGTMYRIKRHICRTERPGHQ